MVAAGMSHSAPTMDSKDGSDKLGKRLLFRLSSFGDVVLCMAALEAPWVKETRVPIDWVVAEEFSSLLEGHPRVSKVHCFARKSGFRSWVGLCRQLWETNYVEVFDMHGSLRTRLARILFLLWSLNSGKPMPKWKVIGKQRLSHWGYFLLKGFWPKLWRPVPWREHFAKFVGGRGDEKPRLQHLLTSSTSALGLANPPPYFCVMPSSRWRHKEWSHLNFLQFIKSQKLLPVIMGTASDKASQDLVNALKAENLAFVSGVGIWSLKDSVGVIAKSKAFISNDTGFFHVAEAVGVPALVIMGPTVPDSGFGPWSTKSKAVGLPILCRPCGKTGQFCHRIFARHSCLRELPVEKVAKAFSEITSAREL